MDVKWDRLPDFCCGHISATGFTNALAISSVGRKLCAAFFIDFLIEQLLVLPTRLLKVVSRPCIPTLLLNAAHPVVDTAISNGSLPYDANGIYSVLTAPSVGVDGFCTSFCGYHNYKPLSNGKNAIYLFAGDASQCPKVCSVQK